MEAVGHWDSSLLLFLAEAEAWGRAQGIPCDTGALPEKVRALLAPAGRGVGSDARHSCRMRRNFFAAVGLATHEVVDQGREIVQFVGECALGLIQLVRRPGKFRWRDC